MPEDQFLRFVFGTPLTARGDTIGKILSRKVMKSVVRDAIHVDAEPKQKPRKLRKRSMEEQTISPALAKLALLNHIAKLAEIEKEAPFKSQAQRRKFYAMASRGEISKKEVRKWERETPKGKKLPERIHRKAAAAGLLMGLGRGLLGAAKGLGRGALGAGKFMGKSMIWPTTKSQMGAGMAGWAGLSGVQAGAAHQPTTGMRMSYAADYLLELTKEAIEVRDHMPASSDVAEPSVKKNALSKSSALVFPGATGRGTSVGMSARPSSINPGTAWLSRSTTKPAKHTKLEGPESRQVVGSAPEKREPGPEAGTHINRPTV